MARSDDDASVHRQLRLIAAETGLNIEGGDVRRTSSRFCFGVEHGDYNGTDLFGIGTDRFIWMAFKPNDRNSLRLFSANFSDEGVVEVPLDHAVEAADVADSWARFPLGAIHVLRTEGYPVGAGFDAVLVGNIPGGGMSRSASLSLNLILTLLEVNGTADVDTMRVARLAQKIETDYIGSPCGILDQVMIAFARAGMGTHYSLRSGKVSHLPFGGDPETLCIASLDTGTKRPGLEKSTYRVRREECAAMTELLQAEFGWETLAEIRTLEDFERATACLRARGNPSAARLKYLFEAQQRFAAMLEAWKAGDVGAIGRNFRLDGFGLRDDYEISGPELEAMCEIARGVDGVYGERMLGGGDKGASGAILRPDAFPALKAAVESAYPKRHPEYADAFAVHSCRMVEGVTCARLQTG